MRVLYSSGDGLAEARAWVSPVPDADELAALTGQDTAQDAPAAGGEDGKTPESVAIQTPLWPLFDLFRRSERCWRYPPMVEVPIGLDWTQVRCLAEALKVPWDAQTLDLMQAMEEVAATAWMEAHKRKNPPGKGRPAG